MGVGGLRRRAHDPGWAEGGTPGPDGTAGPRRTRHMCKPVRGQVNLACFQARKGSVIQFQATITLSAAAVMLATIFIQII